MNKKEQYPERITMSKWVLDGHTEQGDNFEALVYVGGYDTYGDVEHVRADLVKELKTIKETSND